METLCCGSQFKLPNVKTVSIPASDIMGELAATLPDFSWGNQMNFGDKDPVVHRLIGDVNGASFDHFKMVSFSENASTEDWSERKFVGQINQEMFDYTIAVKRHGNQVEISATIRQPEIPDTPNISFTLDLAKNAIVKSCPNILEIPDEDVAKLDPISTMVFLASNEKQEYNKACLFATLGLTFLSCGGLLIAPGVGVAAFLLCAGPATAAAIIGCKKKVSKKAA